MEALKVYLNEREQNCCECGEPIKPNQKLVWRKRRLVVHGDNILDIAPCCLSCARKKGWVE